MNKDDDIFLCLIMKSMLYASRRKTLVSTGDRSAKIRTYNFPQGRITDHRINYTIYNLQAFLGGDIQEVIDKLIIAENDEKLQSESL